MIAWACPAERLVTFLVVPLAGLHVNARPQVQVQPHVIRHHEVRQLRVVVDPEGEQEPWFYCMWCRQIGPASEWEMAPGLGAYQAVAAAGGEEVGTP